MPHLHRRGRVWQYRRRSPLRLHRRGLRPFFLVSLRTHLFAEAVWRAHLLDAALDPLLAWSETMFDMATRPVTAERIDAVVGELFAGHVAEILRRHLEGGPRTEAEAEAALDEIEGRRRDLDRAARVRDPAPVEEALQTTLAEMGLAEPVEAPVARRLRTEGLAALRSATAFEHALESHGCVETAADEARIPAERLVAAKARVDRSAITLQQAVDAAIRYAVSDDMRNHVKSAARVMIELLGGGMPLDSIGREDLLGVLLFARRLPLAHGRSHGINAHTLDKEAARAARPTKAAEIAAADAADAAVRVEVAAMDLPDHEKLFEVERRLCKWVNAKTIQKLHAHMMHPFKAARDHLDWTGTMPASVMETYRAKAAALAKEENAEGAAMVTRTRERRSWSDERLRDLLQSPVYRGSASPSRRYLPGRQIIRDAIYWLPLIMVLMGLRPSEILQLHKSDVIRRNGDYALSLNTLNGKRLKNKASARLGSIHRTLVALGFIEWVNAQREKEGVFLFPEIMHAIDVGDSPSRRFGERFNPVRRHLGLLDDEEDLYALRRTFATRLSNAGVAEADRDALLGHAQAGMTNLHYTDRDLKRLQGEIDKIDLHLIVKADRRHGFPVIVACDAVSRPSVAIDVDVDRDGNPVGVTLYEGEAVGAKAYAVRIAPLPCWPTFGESTPDADAVRPADAAARLRAMIGDRRPRIIDRRGEPAFEALMSH